MSRDNPTPLRIGSTGTLNGWRVRIAGRLVMSMEDGRDTYYWNEFNLVDDDGTSASLVFEETEDGAEWKLFREIAPLHPISVAEAASKRVGDMVNLDGTPVRVTLVDESRVHHIEGVAPEGVDVGDVANYFNADAGNRMLVASWTGHEIEFYEGLDASAESVADAFKIPRDAAPGTASYLAAATRNAASSGGGSTGVFTKIVIGLFSVATLFGAYSCFSSSGKIPSPFAARPRAKIAASALQLPTGARGTLAEHNYVIDAHAVVEIARVAGRHDRREYQLHDDASQAALLVNGLSGGSKEWHLFRPAPVTPGLTPHDAATRRKGTAVNIEGRAMRIVDLFQSKTAGTSGVGNPGTQPAPLQYGFVASDAGEWLIARWTENQIQFLRGRAIPEAEVITALGPKTK
jgi:hypothetical protein